MSAMSVTHVLGDGDFFPSIQRVACLRGVQGWGWKGVHGKSAEQRQGWGGSNEKSPGLKTTGLTRDTADYA